MGNIKKKIDVGDLEIGMCVTDLDRPWLETPMLFQGYEIHHIDDDPFNNHPLFKSEEQARLEETMDGTEPAVPVAAGATLPWPGEQHLENTEAVAHMDDSLWGRSRDFDWGD